MAVNETRVRYIVRGITYYVSRIYKSEKYLIKSSEIEEEDLALPNRLKILFSEALDHFKNRPFVTAHNHCVTMENRVDHVTRSFRTGILELAKEHEHERFLQECTVYILSATEMERSGFPEAIDIVMGALYNACIRTQQHVILVQWGTPNERRENAANNILNNGTNRRNNEEQHNNEEERNNDAQLGNYA